MLQYFRFVAVAAVLAMVLAGCAKPPERSQVSAYQPLPSTVTPASGAKPAYRTASINNSQVDDIATGSIGSSRSSLAGRTLRVASISDLRLRPREVILTFDDGPSPTHTPKILAALDDYNVKATFFMVGHMAQAHAGIARDVSLAGHTIGTHTHRHENLAQLSEAAALRTIGRGEEAIAGSLAPIGVKPAPFFRFPYLAHTSVLRADLGDLDVVIFDVDVDSLDFKKDSADTVLARTLSRLEAKGGGILLFHDIHARTAKMMPEFLAELKRRGFKVVHAVPANQRFPGIEMRNATVSAASDSG